MKKIILLLFLLLYSCHSNKSYINKAIDIMEENSIKKDLVDWKKMRTQSLIEIKKNNTRENAYQIIRKNLSLIQDNHSMFLTKESLQKIYSKDNAPPDLNYDKIKDSIAYISIPSFLGNEKQTIDFAQQIQEIIKILDTEKVEKWIIDLRNNRGGNMWPMYLGLAPILREGVSGYFINSKGNYSEWVFKYNSVFEGKSKMLELKNSYKIKANKTKIAVLINSNTGSSGEAIAVMFKKFPNTLFFGGDSYGVSTGNSTYDMNDGAKLVLTTAVFADRTKEKYGQKIKPDVYSLDPRQSAVEWLEKN
ncbi:S41 family peptidase [Aureibaculum sp. 2210JD6-5]|uniref:S41 family peptidase n=1 Tax=Aureibaculum sp. 2210JD6-5 TaxID=3103957 RepID=UPI002AACEF30|nr:S41 family peptidase [Aureibaculum sp. 2210JD6-5]MDY7393786.1 S41 family peptidase [Aureibaculum sp. 2210JD6-5]